jgi:hypothetical protein
MHNNIFLKEKKTTTISKSRRFYRWALHYFFNFLLFGNVSWTTNMRAYGHWKTVSYILYVINFIQSFSSNDWIKNNFDSKWTLNSKMLWCNFLSFLLVFKIIKGYHQNFNLLRNIILVIHHLFLVKSGSPFVCFHPNVTYSKWLGTVPC